MDDLDLKPGDRLPDLVLPPITRTDLVLFAGASGDHNRIHIDIDYARHAGMTDVFGQGMLSMAWVGRCLTQSIPQHRIRSLNARFLGIAHLCNAMTCTARVEDVTEDGAGRQAKIVLLLANQYGEQKVAAEAVVSIGKEAGRHG